MSCLLALSACESTEHRARRLRTDQSIACNSSLSLGQVLMASEYVAPSQKQKTIDSLLDRNSELQSECDVATREMNQFMAGR